MKKCIAILIMLALLVPACAAEAPAWIPRQIEEPETPLQQALYELALEQAAVLRANISAVWERVVVPEYETGSVSDELFAFLEQGEKLFEKPASVLLMLPREGFGGDFPEEMWSTLGLGLSYQANNSMLESRQAAFLESLSLYGARELPAGRGVCHLVCVYGEGLPVIATAVLLDEDGPSACKTNLIFHKQMAETMAYMGMTINLWGENAIECVYVRP